MANGTRNIRLLISEDCFAFLADAMCAYSKKTARFQTLRSTVQHACRFVHSVDVERQDLETFLAGLPVEGRIRVWLEVKADWLADYDAARTKLAQISGKTVPDKAVVPYLLHLARSHAAI